MSDLRFDNNNEEFGRPLAQSQGFDLSGKLVQWGLVASRQEANYVLIGVGGLALVVAAFLMFSGGSDAPPPPPIGV